ncbi:Fur family transcriptional regulator [Schleiferia thermophila]|uniref:Fur family transcriptional regulator n=1 Tax=Schleiferia thermophila TaxID=884107 RepID=UPI00136405A0|nr:transcriptional repressor [Schleiferia thermophila]
MQKEFVSAGEILKKSPLKATRWRLVLLEMIMKSTSGISYQELSESKDFEGHRVTLYRALRDLEDAGIIEKLRDASGNVKYMMKPKESGSHRLHPHFSCRICNSMVCLTDIELPDISLPAGYTREQVVCLVYGLCKSCASTTS